MKRETQLQQVKKYLEAGNSITPIEALERFGCFRLADIIWRIRKNQHVYTTMVTNKHGNRFAKYSFHRLDSHVWNNNEERVEALGW